MYKGFFGYIGRIQSRFYIEIVLIALTITIFLGFNATQVAFESDISEEMPKNMGVFKDTLYFKENFKGSDVILVTFELDNINDNPIEEITNVKVIKTIYSLDGFARELGKVQDTQSLGSIFKTARMYPANQEIVDMVLSGAGDIKSKFIADDKRSSLFILYVDNLQTKEDIDSFVKVIQNKIQRANPPYGVKVRVSGNPSLKSNLHEHLESDYFFTIGSAIALIFLFILLIMRRIKSTLLVLMPIVVGLVWYAGLIHLLGLKLSVSTVATGAMVVGLGVEYSIFIFNKLEKSYEQFSGEIDERLHNAVQHAVGLTGRAIFGSALTTTAAFLSLTISIIPMLSHLGLISAIGILCILFNSVFVNPCIFITIEKLRSVKNE